MIPMANEQIELKITIRKIETEEDDYFIDYDFKILESNPEINKISKEIIDDIEEKLGITIIDKDSIMQKCNRY